MREMTVLSVGWGGGWGSSGLAQPVASAAKAQNKPRRVTMESGSHRAVSAAHPPRRRSLRPCACILFPPLCGCLLLKGSSPLVPPLHARAQTHARTQARTPCQMPAQRSDAEEERRSPTDSHHSRAVSSTNASERADENPGIRASQIPCRKLHWRIRCCGNLSAQI